ncbi:MAG: DUF418 domain-containing protein [Planctomycetota bacterium]
MSLTTPAALRPTQVGDRIAALDVARGLALFGIFMVNVQFMVQPLTWMFDGGGADEGPLAAFLYYLTRVFFESKSYPLFSMLFGMGLVLMYDRAKAAGRGFAGVYIRRLVLLLLFGMAHAWLVWYGDILIYYACFGFLVMWLAPLRPKPMLIIAVTLTLAAALWVAGMAGLGAALGTGNGEPPMSGIENATFDDLIRGLKAGEVQSGPLDPAWGDAETDAMTNGPYATAVAMRALNWVAGIIFWVGFAGIFLHVPAMFLLGGAVMRFGVLSDPASPWPKRFVLLGLVVGLPGAIAGVLMTELSDQNSPVFTLSTAVVHLAGPLMSLAYGGIAVWMARSTVGTWLVRAVAASGRMAMTNYLMQSLLVAAFAQHWGMGRFGDVTRIEMVIMVLTIYIGQLAFSSLWLRAFTMGPFEYVWRTATYFRFPRLLRRPAAVGGP